MSVASIYLNGWQFKPDIVDTTYQITSKTVPIYWGTLELSNRRLIVNSPCRGNYQKGEKITVYGRAGDCYAWDNGEADNTDHKPAFWMTEESYQQLVKNSIIVSGGVNRPTIYLLSSPKEVAA